MYVPSRDVCQSFSPLLLERARGGGGEEEGTREQEEIPFLSVGIELRALSVLSKSSRIEP